MENIVGKCKALIGYPYIKMDILRRTTDYEQLFNEYMRTHSYFGEIKISVYGQRMREV